MFCGILLSMLSLAVQAQGWQVPQPSPGLMPNPASGKKLFLQNCAAGPASHSAMDWAKYGSSALAALILARALADASFITASRKLFGSL